MRLPATALHMSWARHLRRLLGHAKHPKPRGIIKLGLRFLMIITSESDDFVEHSDSAEPEEVNAEPVEITQDVENVSEESPGVEEVAEPESCLNVDQTEKSNSVAEDVEEAEEASDCVESEEKFEQVGGLSCFNANLFAQIQLVTTAC